MARYFLALPVNAVHSTSATSASEIQRSSSLSQIALGYLIGVQAVSGMAAMSSRTLLHWATAREKLALCRRQAATTLWEKNAKSARTTTTPVAPMARTTLMASAISVAAPLAEPADPFRSRSATATGAAMGWRHHDLEVQAADLGVAVFGTLLGGAVDLLNLGVDVQVDHLVRAGQ
ncbi:hypothetical protein GA0115237_1030120 [Streptomyces sp. ScaeMP-6W]|uniref:hypothetical protein n=1 Tax=unclassified Streptomyces TaxID=2593676 RepID=UPI00081D5D0C|nr:hypothetical protein [Streptomyces sp. ScaeMP-6W]SCD56276.1 hypothetical protein GA0115237_1030120 [Streptomyces sp. ScaeMP-6W]